LWLYRFFENLGYCSQGVMPVVVYLVTHFITNFTQNLLIKIWKSMNIWRRYGQKLASYFLAQPVVQLSRTDGA